MNYNKKIKWKIISILVLSALILLIISISRFNYMVFNKNVLASLIILADIGALTYYVFPFNRGILDNMKDNNNYIRNYFNVLDYTNVVILAILIVNVLYSLILFPALVQQTSMEPNLHPDNRLIILNGNDNIKRSDIIVFEFNTEYQDNYNYTGDDKLLIKRVIGLPGETVTMMSGKLYINGVEVYEEYLHSEDGEFLTGIGYNTKSNDFNTEIVCKASKNPDKCLKNNLYVIPKDYYLVLGDNRVYSVDSVDFGLVHKSQILGEAKFVMDSIIKWKKIGD